MHMPISENYELHLDGQALPVYHTDVADFAVVCFTGEKELIVSMKRPYEHAVIRPERMQKNLRPYGGGFRLWLTDADRVSVEPYGHDMPLLIFCAPYIAKPDGATHIFKRGTYTDIGSLELTDGDTVYLEDGAVVTGCFRARNARDITITGNGIVWNTPLHNRDGYRPRTMITPVACTNVHISGITLIDHPQWNIAPTACDGVRIHGVNIIGIIMCSDGIDIVGCRNADVSHCFIYVNDDCLVVKGSRYPDELGTRSVNGLRFYDCILWNNNCGNAIEIGYETSCNDISDIIFEDIDVIHCELEGWQSGGVFTIHNGDRAHIHNVIYRNIRVEEADEKLIDIKVLSSKYSNDRARGRIYDILFENIFVKGDMLPPSIIRGFEAESGDPALIEDICIRNLYLEGVKIENARQAHLISELSRRIVFE